MKRADIPKRKPKPGETASGWSDVSHNIGYGVGDDMDTPVATHGLDI